jgi:hypothetical protein
MPLLNENGTIIFAGWQVVLLAFAAAGAAGFTAGLLYRVGAAVALTLVTGVMGFFLSSNHGVGLLQSILYAIGLMTILQIGYLLGASLAVTLSRARARGSVRGLVAALFRQNTAR